MHGIRAHAFAVTKDGDAVGNREDFFEPVGDVDDADTAALEIAHDAKEQLHFLLRQRRGRLVHDDDAGAGTERAGDLDKLLLGHRERADLGVGGNLRPDALQELSGTGVARGPIDAAAGGDGFEAQRDVLSDGEVGEQRGLLVNAGDAQFARGGGREVADWLPRYFNRSAVGLMRAGDDLDEGGFSRAVLAEQGVNLARAQVERHALQRAHAAIGLAHLLNSNQSLFCHVPEEIRSLPRKHDGEIVARTADDSRAD